MFSEEWKKALWKPTIKNVDEIDWNKYPHFKPDYEAGRFHCGCGKDHPSYIDEELLELLERIRVKAGIPMYISSAFRCPEHNKAVGGKPMSVHQVGRAVDVGRIRNGRWRYPLVKIALECGVFRIGLAKSFVHIDNIRPNESMFHVAPTLWLY